MTKFFIIIPIVFSWVLSIVNTTGLGITYDTPTKTNYLIFIWYLFIYFKNSHRISFNRNFILIFFTLLSFIIIPFIKTNSFDGVKYLMMVPFTYCISKQYITESVLKLCCNIIALLGLSVIYLFNNTDIFSGWNDNHLAMISLFSYIFYSITLYGDLSRRKLTVGLLISLLYVFELTQNSNSRSCYIFIILTILFVYGFISFNKIIKSKYFLLIALNVPLFICVFSISFQDLTIFSYFNEWSQNNFDKTDFNGRIDIWIQTFQNLKDTKFIGEGKFMVNHHNSAAAIIGVFGVIGYICWYNLFEKPINFLKRYINDSIVLGCLISFLLIFWQQSFELGFVSTNPNMIPYVILGIGLARAKKININASHKYNNSSI